MNIALTIPLADSWSMHGSVAGWWIPMMALMVLFWAAVIWGVVWLIRGASDDRLGRRGETPEPRRETPTEILERRFAEGALTPDDYRARREVLVNGGSDSNGAHTEEPLTVTRAGEGSQ